MYQPGFAIYITLAYMSHPLTPQVEELIRQALIKSWSEKTSAGFNPNAPRSYCQCAQTAIVISEHFGGEILKTPVLTVDGSPSDHFYNRIGGCRYDFTADQFSMPNTWQPFTYQDIVSSCSEAADTLSADPRFLGAMRGAFKIAWEALNVG